MSSAKAALPTRLRVEHLDDTDRDRRPAAAAVVVAARRGSSHRRPTSPDRRRSSSGRVDSDQHVLVPWPATTLGPASGRVAGQGVDRRHGASDWSAPALFETGLLDPSDWSARGSSRTSPSAAEPGAAARVRAAPRVRPRSAVDAGPPLRHRARHLRDLPQRRPGRRPRADAGLTSYPTDLHVQTYDVTDLLVARRERVGGGAQRRLVPRPQRHPRSCADGYGDTVAFLGQLHVGDRDGRAPSRHRRTGGRPPGRILGADLMAGQAEDRRHRGRADWRPGRRSSTTASTRLAAHRRRRCGGSRSCGRSSVTRLAPEAARSSTSARTSTAGSGSTDLGPAGTEITLTHGEALDDRRRRHHGPPARFDRVDRRALDRHQVDRVRRPAASGEVFEPRHTTHGFQYVRIEGHPHRARPDDVTGVVVHTDLAGRAGSAAATSASTGSTTIAEWSFRDNACDIPTDCPHRERAGMDRRLAGLRPDRGVPLRRRRLLAEVAARPRRRAARRRLRPQLRPRSDRRVGAADHRSARRSSRARPAGATPLVIVPWELYRAYGDRDVLAELWPRDGAVGRLRRRPRPGTEAPPDRAEAPARARRRTSVPLGQRLPLGRVAANRATTDASQRWSADHGPRRDGVPPPLRRPRWPRIGRLLGHDDDAERYDELADARRSTRGAPSTSPTTAH